MNLVIFVLPILYIYLTSVFDKSFELNKKSSRHLIIPALFTVYHILIWMGSLLISPESKVTWVSEFGYFEVQFAHNIILLVFLCIYPFSSYLAIRKSQKNPPSKTSAQVQQMDHISISIFLPLVYFFELTSTLLGRIYGYWKSSPLDDWLGFSLTMAIKIYNAILLYIISLNRICILHEF